MSTSSRSQASRAFQQQWMKLRKDNESVPRFQSTDILSFAEFVHTLVLIRVDFDTRTMPVEYAGSLIRDLLGFEMTGHDFLEFDIPIDSDASWGHRRAYHDHPYGRYEELDIKFRGGGNFRCALTSLPVFGAEREPKLLTLVERLDASIRPELEQGKISGDIELMELIDLGAGVPDWAE